MLGASLFILPEPGKLSTTMQNDDDGGMSEVVKNVMHEIVTWDDGVFSVRDSEMRWDIFSYEILSARSYYSWCQWAPVILVLIGINFQLLIR